MDKNLDLNSWDGFAGENWIKPSEVKENQNFVVTSVTITEDEEHNKIKLELESDKIKYSFELNKVNVRKLQELGVISPKSLIGQVIQFKKVVATNPQTKKEVDSLRINSVFNPGS